MNSNNDKKLFVNKTVYNAKVYEEFLQFHGKRYNLAYWLYTGIWTVVLFFCIIIAFGSQMSTQAVLINIILVCFIGYRILKPKFIIKRELKGDKVSDSSLNTFSFYDNYLMVANKEGKFRYKFLMLRRVFETNSFFYLYVSRENAFLIDKNGFSLGTSKEFSDFIKGKCKFKFKKVNN